MAEQRRFERYDIPENALAVDDEGHPLGHVTVAGGGGMAIALDPPVAPFSPGQRMRVTVIEPGPRNRHTLDVVVRYRHENSLGVEFISGKSA